MVVLFKAVHLAEQTLVYYDSILGDGSKYMDLIK
jgi:hypothetical protein